MASIDTPLLIIGRGPAVLVAAKAVSGRGLPCLIAGHQPIDDTEPVVLDQESLSILEPNGVLDVLRPYAHTQDPFTIAPIMFEHGLKHHCVADMLITVFDEISVEELSGSDDERGRGAGVSGVLTDGTSRWQLHADAVLDAATMPTELNAAIRCAAEFGNQLLAALH